MFEKINFKLENLIFNVGSPLTSYGKIPNIAYYILSSHNVDLSYFKYKPAIRYCEVKGYGMLRPHRDHDITCCVNFYLETNDCLTTFYNKKENAKTEQYPGRASSNLYNIEDLNEVSSFKANNGDCYLLNVSEIHSVTIPKPGVRKFITFNWYDKSYEQIRESLLEK